MLHRSDLEWFGSDLRTIAAKADGRGLDMGANDTETTGGAKGTPVTPDCFGPDGKFRPPGGDR